MRLYICYTLMQLPGTVLVMLTLYFTMESGWLSELSAALILCVWLLKDVVLYPLFRQAMRKGPTMGGGTRVDRGAFVGTDAAETGSVRIQGKRWQAISRDGERRPRATAVHVTGVDGPIWQAEARPHTIRPEGSGRQYPEHSDPDSQPAG